MRIFQKDVKEHKIVYTIKDTRKATYSCAKIVDFLSQLRVLMLHNIRIVLIETTNTGNIGATARAMKNMGLTKLYLVNPSIKPDAQAIALAANASDIISNFTHVDTVDDAIKDCILVFGASARARALPWLILDPRECGVRAVNSSKNAPVALVFGPERIGLTNDNLQKCHYHVVIPANPDYSSLNLAMAVQILAYEVRLAYLAFQKMKSPRQKKIFYPSVHDLEYFYKHLEKTFQRTGFIRSECSGKVIRQLRRLFSRAYLEKHELSILRGMLTSIEKKLVLSEINDS